MADQLVLRPGRGGGFTRKSSFGRRVLWIGASAGLLVAAALGITQYSTGNAQSLPAASGVRITGTLKLVVPRIPGVSNSTGTGAIMLPDRKVTLRNGSGSDVASAITLLDGRFDLIAPSAGTYSVCWEIGESRGCSKQLVVSNKTVGTDVLARLATPVLYGLVLTGDDRPCWVQDSYFKLDVATFVAAGGKKVRANIRGEYAIVGLAPATYTLTANCENARVSQQVAMPAGGANVKLALPNHAPRLVATYATDGTKSLTRAAPGAMVKLVADTRDPDGDRVEHLWRTLGAGTVGSGNSATESWQLPNDGGQTWAYVVARDGKGGYAFRRLDLRTGSLDLTFSGRVLDEVTGQPIRDAMVSVGTGSGSTNAMGWFSLATKPQADDRYVLNITRENYAPVSRVFDKDATDETYSMIRAQVDTLPASGVIRIVDTRSSGACGNPQQGEATQPIGRLVQPTPTRPPTDRLENREAATTRGRAETLALVGASETPRCDPRGIEIVIPAGALVDSRGNAPVGSIRASSATLNPARRALPGDYQATPTAGGRAELFSYGAVYAEFTDSAGNKLNLRSGANAGIHVPVSNEARPTAPPSIALWSYDNKTGLWVEEGTATLQNTPSGWAYVGSTRHFSELNMDVAGNDPDHATCARVEKAPGHFQGWSNLILRAYVSYGGAPPPQVKEVALDNQQYHAIFRIPFDTGFANTLRLELRGTKDNVTVVLLDNIYDANVAPFQKMPTNDLWPDSPYDACAPLVLSEVPGVVPPYGDIDGFGRPAFLAGPYGTYNPADGDAQATAYYAALDNPTPKGNLGLWWGANGFDPVTGLSVDPSFVQIAYMNHNDLGFGRNMHCRKNSNKLACYVTNYGLPDQKAQNADDALAQSNPGATVAMEFDPNNGSEAVQFYVYGGAVAGSPRLKFADLDGLGPKPVPGLCQVCHGGGPGLNANNKVEDAHFREFDLVSFRFPGDIAWDSYGEAIAAGQTPSLADFNKFAQLNQMVRDSNTGNEIARTINDWYRDDPANNFSGQPLAPTLPPNWAGQGVSAGEYELVYGKTCRTCHIARDFPDFIGVGGLDFYKSTFPVSRVCGDDHDNNPATPKLRVMPNASITYRNFWTDTPRVHAYESLVGIAQDTCKL